MNEWISQATNFITLENSLSLIRALVLAVAGLVIAKLTSGVLARTLKSRLETHQVMIWRRGSYYTLLTLFLVAAMHQLGFNLSILLGAAGILTVAVGFASQTSASNMISGLFLIAERPFSVGDIIRVGQTTGEVLSVDLLSVKIRTFDNLFVRVPNETLVKSEITTLTRFPIRRVDLPIGVAYKEDLSRVRSVLLRVAEKNAMAMEDPKPLFLITGFGDSSIDLQFSVWGKRENYLNLKNSLLQGIKENFDAEGIEIPFPHLSLYAGSVTNPLPLRFAQVPTGNQTPVQ